VLVLIYAKRVNVRSLGFGLFILFLIGLPIGLFVLINLLHLDTIHLGAVTIPRLPTQPRWETVTVLSGGNPFRFLIVNFISVLKLLWAGSDGLTSNSVEPYGYFYPFTLPFAILGAFLLIRYWNVNNKPDRLLLLSWFAASLVIGLIQLVNINRVNLIFIPLILFVAAFLAWLGDRSHAGLIVAIAALLVGFAFFTREYHSSQYQHRARKTFVSGLVPAVEYASRTGDHPICVTDEVLMPHIFVLFAEQLNPAHYLGTIRYQIVGGEFRRVTALGRYTFGLENCPPQADMIYILSGGKPPNEDINYNKKRFLDFMVYSPK